jgi:hypothetical protein
MSRAAEHGILVSKPWGNSAADSHHRLEPSREAAKEYSPRRKPWVSCNYDQAPVGAKEKSTRFELFPVPSSFRNSTPLMSLVFG